MVAGSGFRASVSTIPDTDNSDFRASKTLLRRDTPTTKLFRDEGFLEKSPN